MNQDRVSVGRFIISGEWPPEIVPLLEDLFSPLDVVLPTWCHECRIWFEKEMTTAAARCRVLYDYREAHIDIGPDFLTGPRQWQRDSIIHEIVHVTGNVLFGHANHYLKELLAGDDKKFVREALLLELKERNESMTCDFARAFSLLLAARQ